MRVHAIGRALCDFTNSVYPQRNGLKLCWLTNSPIREYYGDSGMKGMFVSKNSKFGEILIKYRSGTHEYQQPTMIKRMATIRAEIFNRADYSLTHDQNGRLAVKDLTVHLEGNERYSFQYLDQLIQAQSKLQEQLEQKRKQAEETEKLRKKLEEEARRQQEAEARRIAEEERRKAEEEARRSQEEIAALEQQIEEGRKSIAQTQSFVREGAYLRSQHLLDACQEEAKRSHLYDGVPIVIEGGPGTGKTTTMIQRLKFMLDADALKEYESPLTDSQKDMLTDVDMLNNHWLFFSPTEQLLSFLRHNMQEEGLVTNANNTTVLDLFCDTVLRDYQLRVPDKDGPFKRIKKRDETASMILDAAKAIKTFERFCLTNIVAIMTKVAGLPTDAFPWHKLAVEIQDLCRQAASVKDMAGLMRVLNALQDKEQAKVKKVEQELADELRRLALLAKRDIMADEAKRQAVTELFEKWREETIVSQDDDVEETEMDDTEDEEEDSEQIDVEPKLFQQLRPIFRKLGLKRHDSKQKLSKRQQELYGIIQSHVDKYDTAKAGELAWFSKNFAFLCRGIESNFFNQIPRLYKLYRKDLITKGAKFYNLPLLQKLQKKDGGKSIHREEIELMVGFINNMLHAVYHRSRVRFDNMSKNKYAAAFKQHVKYVIGVDEATDYSLIDYYLIASFRHYEFASITLCGDIMQGLNENGVTDWNDLKGILPGLQVYELRTSYRQLPTLVDLSKRLYQDELGVEAPYSTEKEKSPHEQPPLCFISDDEEEKTAWMAKRIIEVYHHYGQSMPTVAILVGDDVDIDEMVEIMEEQDLLNGIKIYNSSNGNGSSNTKSVRIFKLSEVKGMEFEVAFFYDIDEALAGGSARLMRRYLYVGISRATSHLAATFTREEGNEELLQYFDRTKKNWKL